MNLYLALSKKNANGILFFLSFIVSFLLLNFKKPGTFTHPQFWAEDGAVFFQSSYNLGVRSFFVSYNGYLHLIPRTVAWLTLLTQNYTLTPLFYNLASLIGFMLVFLYIWTRTSFDRYVKFFMSLSLALLPVHNGIVLNLTDLQFYTSLLIILIFMTNQERRYALLDNITIVFVGLTEPFSIIFLPAILVLYYLNVIRNKIQNIRKSTLIVYLLTAALQSFTLITSDPGAAGGGKISEKLAAFPHVVYMQLLNLISIPRLYITGVNYLIFSLLLVALAFWFILCYKEYKLTKNATLIFLLLSSLCAMASTAYRVNATTVSFTPLNAGRYFFLSTTLFLWSFIIYKEQTTKKVLLFTLLYSWYTFVDIRWIGPWRMEDKKWSMEAKKIDAFKEGSLTIPINPTPWVITLRR